MSKMFRRKKIGIALGGGAAKGLAHIGVLKVLEENNIPIDFISGTSMGAVIGALYCANPDAEELEKLAVEMNWKKIIDFNIPKEGLLKGDKLEREFEKLIISNDFKKLRIPFFATAVDIRKNKEVILSSGSVSKAVRASTSLPGIFKPLKYDGKILIDGGLIDPVPIEILKKKGADIVIAIDVEGHRNYVAEKESMNIFEVLLRSFHMIVSARTDAIIKKGKPDVLIVPDLRKVRYVDFHKQRKGILEGEIAAKKELKNIIKVVKKGGFFGRFKK